MFILVMLKHACMYAFGRKFALYSLNVITSSSSCCSMSAAENEDASVSFPLSLNARPHRGRWNSPFNLALRTRTSADDGSSKDSASSSSSCCPCADREGESSNGFSLMPCWFGGKQEPPLGFFKQLDWNMSFLMLDKLLLPFVGAWTARSCWFLAACL